MPVLEAFKRCGLRIDQRGGVHLLVGLLVFFLLGFSPQAGAETGETSVPGGPSHSLESTPITLPSKETAHYLGLREVNLYQGAILDVLKESQDHSTVRMPNSHLPPGLQVISSIELSEIDYRDGQAREEKRRYKQALAEGKVGENKSRGKGDRRPRSRNVDHLGEKVSPFKHTALRADIVYVGDGALPNPLRILIEHLGTAGIWVRVTRVSRADFDRESNALEEGMNRSIRLLKVSHEQGGEGAPPPEVEKTFGLAKKLALGVRDFWGAVRGMSFLTLYKRTIQDRGWKANLGYGLAAAAQSMMIFLGTRYDINAAVTASAEAGTNLTANPNLGAGVAAAWAFVHFFLDSAHWEFKSQGYHYDAARDRFERSAKFYISWSLIHSLITGLSIKVATHGAMAWGLVGHVILNSALGSFTKYVPETGLRFIKSRYGPWLVLAAQGVWWWLYTQLKNSHLVWGGTGAKWAFIALSSLGLGYVLHRRYFETMVRPNWKRMKMDFHLVGKFLGKIFHPNRTKAQEQKRIESCDAVLRIRIRKRFIRAARRWMRQRGGDEADADRLATALKNLRVNDAPW